MSPFKRNAFARRSGVAASPAVARMELGRVYVAERRHDAHCRRPDGGPCTCTNGPDVELVPFVAPEEN